jgi:hypothetical protein
MKDRIINIIESNSRDNIIYIHPIKTKETIAKNICALANTNGGYVIFGVSDDGLLLHPKGNAFKIDMNDINKYLKSSLKYTYSEFNYNNVQIGYIAVEKSAELVDALGTKYIYKDGKAEELTQKSVFISYNHFDKDIALIVETALMSRNILVTRDENEVEYKDDLELFMQSITNHDYVVSIVSDAYLKSVNCMYEVSELMRDRNYYDKLLFIRIGENDKQFYIDEKKHFLADIYSHKRFEYIKYWVDRKDEIDEYSKGIDISHSAEIAQESKKHKIITYNIEEFIAQLKKGLAIGFDELVKNEFKEFIDIIETR